MGIVAVVPIAAIPPSLDVSAEAVPILLAAPSPIPSTLSASSTVLPSPAPTSNLYRPFGPNSAVLVPRHFVPRISIAAKKLKPCLFELQLELCWESSGVMNDRGWNKFIPHSNSESVVIGTLLHRIGRCLETRMAYETVRSYRVTYSEGKTQQMVQERSHSLDANLVLV